MWFLRARCNWYQCVTWQGIACTHFNSWYCLAWIADIQLQKITIFETVYSRTYFRLCFGIFCNCFQFGWCYRIQGNYSRTVHISSTWPADYHRDRLECTWTQTLGNRYRIGILSVITFLYGSEYFCCFGQHAIKQTEERGSISLGFICGCTYQYSLVLPR